MVLVACRREEVKQREESNKMKSAMSIGPERSRSLHNFSLPCLRWGTRRHLRCVKDNGNGSSGGGDHFPVKDRRSPASISKSPYNINYDSASRLSPKPPPLGSERKRRSLLNTDNVSKISRDQNPPPSENRRQSSPFSTTDDTNGIEAMRKKLVLDLQTEMNRMKFTVLNTTTNNKEVDIKPPAAKPLALKTDSKVEEVRPWNLRRRRAICKDPNGKTLVSGGSGGDCKELRIDERKPKLISPTTGMKSLACRWSDGGEKRERMKFSVALSKQEMEDDFVAIMGMRPPKRPKKRARVVQKQINAVFPGLWLTEITGDMYEVIENPEVGKR